MKVLVINCSPVRNGATAEIVTDCLEKRHNVKNIWKELVKRCKRLLFLIWVEL